MANDATNDKIRRMSGAGVGAMGGALLGGYGGPLVPATVPALSALGGAAGYFAPELASKLQGKQPLERHKVPPRPLPSGPQRGDVEDYLGKAQKFGYEGGLAMRLDAPAEVARNAIDAQGSEIGPALPQRQHGMFRESSATVPVYATSAQPQSATGGGVGGALNVGPTNTSEALDQAPQRSQPTPLPTWEDMFAKYLQMAGGGRTFASANLVNQFATGAAASQLNSLAANAARQRAGEKDVYQEWKDRQAMKQDKARTDLEAKRLGIETQKAERELSAIGPQGLSEKDKADIEYKRALTGQLGSKEELAREKMLMTLRAQLAELPVGTKERELAEQQLQILEQGETPEYFYEPEQTEQNYWRPEFLGGKPDVPYKAEQYGYRAKPKKPADKTALGQPTFGTRG